MKHMKLEDSDDLSFFTLLTTLCLPSSWWIHQQPTEK